MAGGSKVSTERRDTKYSKPWDCRACRREEEFLVWGYMKSTTGVFCFTSSAPRELPCFDIFLQPDVPCSSGGVCCVQ